VRSKEIGRRGARAIVAERLEPRRLFSATISGRVVIDENFDGKLDAGDASSGAWVWVDTNDDGYIGQNEPQQYTYTGSYTLTVPGAGTYRVTCQPLGGLRISTPGAGFVMKTVASSGAATGVNFLLTGTTRVSGTVYEDVNGDAQFGPLDRPLAGRTVFADKNNNEQLDPGEISTTSAADGSWVLDGVYGLEDGLSDVRQVIPAGWRLASQDWGLNPAMFGQDESGLNFGSARVVGASVAGTLFNDLNANGKRDSFEPEGYNEAFYADINNDGFLNPGEPIGQTFARGRFMIDHLPVGTYYIRHAGDQFGHIVTTPDRLVTVKSSSDRITGLQFGMNANEPDEWSIYGSCTDTAAHPLAGRVVFLDTNGNNQLDLIETSTTTDAQGRYWLTGFGPASGVVRPIEPDAPFFTIVGRSVSVAGATLMSLPTFALHLSLGSLQVNVFDDRNGNGVRDGTEAPLIGVTVYLDLNNNGKFDAGSETAYSTRPRGNVAGAPYFHWSAAVTDYVRVVPPAGYDRTYPAGTDPLIMKLTPGQTLTLIVGMAPTPTPTGTIRGTAYLDNNGSLHRDSGDGMLAGATVYLDLNDDGRRDVGEPLTTTDASGGYAFLNLRAGTYHVRQLLPAGVVARSPGAGGERSVTLAAGQSATGQDFADQRIPTASISGVVFSDANGDGLRQATEAALAGWTVYIDLNNNGKFDAGEAGTLTDSSGKWALRNLFGGTYVVRAVRPSGWSQTRPAGSAGLSVALTSGQAKTGFLFAERRIA